MTTLADKHIRGRLTERRGSRKRAKSRSAANVYAPKNLVIEPFHAEPVTHDDNGDPIVSYGLSACGYDVRLGYELELMPEGKRIDLRAGTPSSAFHEKVRPNNRGELILPAGRFAKAESVEWLRIPEDVVGDFDGRSTWQRLGLVMWRGWLEPGWEGTITIELLNPHRHNDLVLYAGQGIGQVQFRKLTGKPNTPYHKRNGGLGGKYQRQSGITPAIMGTRPGGG